MSLHFDLCTVLQFTALQYHSHKIVSNALWTTLEPEYEGGILFTRKLTCSFFVNKKVAQINFDYAYL